MLPPFTVVVIVLNKFCKLSLELTVDALLNIVFIFDNKLRVLSVGINVVEVLPPFAIKSPLLNKFCEVVLELTLEVLLPPCNTVFMLLNKLRTYSIGLKDEATPPLFVTILFLVNKFFTYSIGFIVSFAIVFDTEVLLIEALYAVLSPLVTLELTILL